MVLASVAWHVRCRRNLILSISAIGLVPYISHADFWVTLDSWKEWAVSFSKVENAAKAKSDPPGNEM